LSKFFTVTGALLIVVAAGVFAYGIHDLQEAGWIPGLDDSAFDISTWYSASSWYGTLLKGMFNFSPNPSVVETVMWFAYIVPVGLLFLFAGRTSRPQSMTRSTVTTSTGAPTPV
jgi:high-affinity iron transporter